MTVRGEIRRVSGYVLAGGQSSRMGKDKSRLLLGGRPLIAHAVMKLRRVCAEVNILSSDSELAVYAPLVEDLHPGCGPIGGLEAALQTAVHEWVLLYAVDVPFLPSVLLRSWVNFVLDQGIGMSLFRVDGRPQPTICMVHRRLILPIAEAVAEGRWKLYPTLVEAAALVSGKDARACALEIDLNSGAEQLLPFAMQDEGGHAEGWRHLTEAQRAAAELWFMNVNTPADWAQAQGRTDLLDT